MGREDTAQAYDMLKEQLKSESKPSKTRSPRMDHLDVSQIARLTQEIGRTIDQLGSVFNRVGTPPEVQQALKDKRAEIVKLGIGVIESWKP
jgi:hypothetical protein